MMKPKDFVQDFNDTVNKISLAAAAIVLSTWLLIGAFRLNRLKRITLRFQIIIAFIDILRHASNYDIRVESDTLCSIIGASINFSDNIYVSFNTLLAINAWLIFISRQRPKMASYPLYVGALLSYNAILGLCYYTNGAYGRNSYGDCNFKTRDDRIISRFYMIYLMQLPGVLYCAYVVFLVMFKFRDRMAKLRILRSEVYVRVGEESSMPTKYIGDLYWRISMYPISCFVTLFPFLIAMILGDSGVNYPKWYRFLFKFCLRLPGATNFFFMLYDPNFQLACRELARVILRRFRRKTDDDSYELEVQRKSATPKSDQSWYDQICDGEEWKIEFDDGYKMTVQDHIKYL